MGIIILANRNNKKQKVKNDYDIVVGPIADDGVAFQLERYVKHMISLNALVKELTYRHLNRQYFFGTESSISKLKAIND